MVPLKVLSDQEEMRYQCFSSWKLFIFYRGFLINNISAAELMEKNFKNQKTFKSFTFNEEQQSKIIHF